MQIYKPNKIKRIFRTILLFLVNAVCLSFVIYQTINCTIKYINKPQVTIVSLKESHELPSSPAITICPFGGPNTLDMGIWNKSYLEDICGIE